MPPVASTRRGRRISSKACDACRSRKVQCIIDGDGQVCNRCAANQIDCTFLSQRKPRGPPPRPFNTFAVPVGELSLALFCDPSVLRHIVRDYLDLVYPLLPLVHRGTFSTQFETNTIDAAEHEPAFFRLCLALCAVTVASLPKKFNEYSRGRYADIGAMVDRACHLVLLSRISTESLWQEHPATSTVIVSVLLATASLYAGRANQGWGYAIEAIHFFRALGLYRPEVYEHLPPLEREFCKRTFWLLYIMQIHDRLSAVIPHTGLSFDPLRTDWQFMFPQELDDEDIINPVALVTGTRVYSGLPVISGFIALIKVYLCIVDLLSYGLPGFYPPVYATSFSSVHASIHPGQSLGTDATMSLKTLLRIVRKVQTALEQLPDELSISTQPQTPEGQSPSSELLENQFNIMKANIHITSLYIQSTILEACSSAFSHSNGDMAGSPLETGSSLGAPPRTQIWVYRKSIAKELLDVLHFCSSRSLEANGQSVIVKIREIAATLLNNDDVSKASSEQEEESRQLL
ncbi:uncharacterized protein CC84DRAFT_1253872 [Paraphaeosphaeria sporulosa]|uniref:Zn(2)-C6 fungal-type domain-containing protein n=1 Tax=Paraphaeosphaeria sporulosa TaxID=1460663 RepID=A0A177CXF3_9PLEO|nr:uncharacterized protein CC84DRAFT_1253872 [Paraphaeosphaeria sporulosa]OAG11399.1 hypothetical protein CC84DRAFT_1253872 [Paraphaeosphaeria sporulosa]